MEDFVAEIKSGLEVIASKILDLLTRNGISLVLCSTITEHYPPLAGKVPRGWNCGSTWEHACGCFIGREAVVAEFKQDKEGNRVRGSRTCGTLFHEIAHGVDLALGHYAWSASFLAAYLTDVKDWSSETLSHPFMSYYLQDYDKIKDSDFLTVLSACSVGAAETFADVFAAVCGSCPREGGERVMLEKFPHCVERVKVLLASYS